MPSGPTVTVWVCARMSTCVLCVLVQACVKECRRACVQVIMRAGKRVYIQAYKSVCECVYGLLDVLARLQMYRAAFATATAPATLLSFALVCRRARMSSSVHAHVCM